MQKLKKYRFRMSACIVLLLFPFTFIMYSQNNVLDKYIREGIDNNLSLKMKLENYHQSLLELDEAKGLFFPDISLNARYSLAEGGRIIEFPVGDMLNPVYTTLNQLTMSNLFSEISNQEFSFLRPEEHESKIRLVQPVINTDIIYNRKIKENLAEGEKANMETYRRALVADIKKSYYNYLKAIKINDILCNTKVLLEENIRVTRGLFENDKLTRDAVYRSEAEYNKLIQQIAEADRIVISAAAYFNFLLNRELQSEIEIEEPGEMILSVDHENAVIHALSAREEISMLESYYNAGKNHLKLQKADYLPELMTVIDYGYQGTKYRFTSEDDFAMASLLLRWDIFNGNIRKSEIRKAQYNLSKLEKQLQETENLIKLEVLTSYYALQAATKKIPAAESEFLASEEAFRMVEKKYRQGQAALIEFIDARTNKTNAETGLALARYEYLSAWSEFEKVAALFEFN